MAPDPLSIPAGVRFVDIKADEAGQRLDNFLIRHLKGVPRSRIYRLLRRGEVRINKGRARPDYRLQTGDRVRIPPVRRAAAVPAVGRGEDLSWLEAQILYEDGELLALDKPAGLAVHGGSGVRLGLIEALRRLRSGHRFLELVHRLDKQTSGVLLVAKRRSALVALHGQLRRGEVTKHYTALLQGRLSRRKSLEIDVPLARISRPSGDRVVRTAADGRPARSRFRVLRLFDTATLAEIRLHTGRTHQARVHAAYAGHPIAGDDKYGDRGFNAAMAALGLKRMFLHASRLEFKHPSREDTLRLEAPLPPELEELCKRLTQAQAQDHENL